MNSEGAGRKRCVEDCFEVDSVQDVFSWLENVINNGGMGAVTSSQKHTILDAVEQNQIDGEVLKSMTEEDLTQILRVVVFGQRRKLKERIKELVSGVSGFESGQGLNKTAGINLSPQPPGNRKFAMKRPKYV